MQVGGIPISVLLFALTEGIISEMISLEREANRVKKEIVFTVNTICKISGKSSSSLKRTYSLLKLPEEIQNAVREGMIGEGDTLLQGVPLIHLCGQHRPPVPDGHLPAGRAATATPPSGSVFITII
jgi:hypothetical protein